MGDLLIRGVPEEVVAKLKERASRHGRSLQQELLRIVTEAAFSSLEAYVSEVQEHRARYTVRRARGISVPESAELIREDRER